MLEVSEKDWKLFRAKLPDWQEDCMRKLNQEYIEILSSDEKPSEKFWKLEKRIKQDKRRTGVVCEAKRSLLFENLVSLINEDVICFDDLSDFSEDLKEAVKYVLDISRAD